MIRQIVVLAGGLATRLRPITLTIPKSMVVVGGEPFIAHQLRKFSQEGIEQVVLCVGHLSDQIMDFVGNGKRFGLDVVYSQEDEKLDTGGAIKNAYKYLDDIFFTIYGDSHLTENFADVAKFYETLKHPRPQRLAGLHGGRVGGVGFDHGLMTVWKNKGEVAPSQILVDGNYVTKFQKEPTPKGAEHIEYGLNILPKKIINQVPDKVFPISKYFDILIPTKQMLAHEVKDRFYEIGGFEGLEDTRKIV